MKALFRRLSIMAFAYLALPIAVQAQYTYTTNADNTLTITRYTGASASVSIPTNINGKTVTHIGDEVFYQNTYMTTVVIPGTVISIGIRAFYSCTNLTRVAIPNSVTNVSNNAFEWCSRMTNLTIGSGITAIEDYTFRNCTNLLSVTIPSGVISIGNTAFGGCGLTNIVFGSGVKSIGDEAFEACNRLASVTIPNNVTNIGFSAFLACFNLKNVMIGNGVKSIGIEAFSSCIVLTNVVIGSGVTRIGNVAFEGCNSLSSVTIPNSVTSIGGGAFGYCSTLKSVTIPNSVTNLGGGAFQNCYGLTNVVIGSGVTSIGDGAFSSCNSLASVTIPSNVTSIGEQAFSSCTVLTNVVIGSSVTNIGRSAFAACTILKNITVPDNVTSIEDSAFYGCSGLTNAVIGNGVTNIGITAFYNCIGLRGIVIGNKVTDIGDSSFFGDGNLAGVYFRGNAPSVVGANVFSGCTISTVYRLAVASGWPTVPNLWAGRPTALWSTIALAINPASTNLSNAAASGKTIGVTASVAWTAASNVSWIVITSGASGTSNGTVTFSVATNSTSSRTGGIVVAGGGLALTCTVTQAGASLSLVINPTSTNFTSVAANGKIIGVTANISWTATTNMPWIAVTAGSSGTSNGTVTFSVTTNAGITSRTGAIIVAGGGISRTCMVTQAGAAIPSAPTGVLASDGTYSDRIRITWTTSPGATGYEVWRNTNNVSGSATRIGPNIAGSSYDDTTVTQGITNYYWLTATNSGGTSAFSSSDSGWRAFASYRIAGAVSYGGSQTGMVRIMASPHFDAQTNLALSLDGVDDGVAVTNPTTALRLTNTHSFCAWINLGAMPAGSQATILMKYNNTNQASYVASVERSSGRLRYSIGGSDTAYSTSTISTASGWTHIAFTHDGSVGRWYVNGSLDSSLTFSSLERWGDGPLYIGRAIDLQTYFDRFGGGIDEVSLWKRTLNQAEIQALMTNFLTGSEAGLAGYWNFDDGTASDLTTNANNGEFLSGATTTVRAASASQYSADLASPGGYAISNVPAGEYNVSAYRDSNGNGSHDSWEAYGAYPANPLSVTGNMTNVDITLQDPTTDSDGDGLSDYDEVYLHGTLWNNPDTDADGMPDGDEILAGSSPTNGESMFGFADSQPVPEGGGVVVSWPSLSNRVYRLERSTNLLLDFEPLINDLPADPPVNSYTDDTPNALGAYKVGVRME